jgi:hypothetical protein
VESFHDYQNYQRSKIKKMRTSWKIRSKKVAKEKTKVK